MQSIPTKVTVTNYNTQYNFFDLELPIGNESSVTLKGCKIIDGKNGKFVACKSEKRNDKWWPTAYLNGDKLHQVVIDAVEEAKKASEVFNDESDKIPF